MTGDGVSMTRTGRWTSMLSTWVEPTPPTAFESGLMALACRYHGTAAALVRIELALARDPLLAPDGLARVFLTPGPSGTSEALLIERDVIHLATPCPFPPMRLWGRRR